MQLEGPSLSDDPSLEAIERAEQCYEELAQLDVTKETVESTVEAMVLFMKGTLDGLQAELLDLTPLKPEPIVVGVEVHEAKKAKTPSRRSRSPGTSSFRTSPKRAVSPLDATRRSISSPEAPIFAATQVVPQQQQQQQIQLKKKGFEELASAPTSVRTTNEKGDVIITATPLEVFTNMLEGRFSSMLESIKSKLTGFLDERVACDRTTLHYARAQAKKQLYVAREMSESFRRSYDIAHRNREAEAVRLAELELRRTFTYELVGLKKTNKQLEAGNKILTKAVKDLEESVKEYQTRLVEAKSAKKGKKGGASSKHDAHADHHTHHHNNNSHHQHGHGHGHPEGHHVEHHSDHHQHHQHGHGHGHGHDSHHSHHGHHEGHHPHDLHDSMSHSSHDSSHHSHQTPHERPFFAGSKHVEIQQLPTHCHECDKLKERVKALNAKLHTAHDSLVEKQAVVDTLEARLVQLLEARPPSPQNSISISEEADGVTNFGPSLYVDGREEGASTPVMIAPASPPALEPVLDDAAAAQALAAEAEAAAAENEERLKAEAAVAAEEAAAAEAAAAQTLREEEERAAEQAAAEAEAEAQAAEEARAEAEAEAAALREKELAETQTETDEALRVKLPPDYQDYPSHSHNQPKQRSSDAAAGEESDLAAGFIPRLDSTGSIILPDDPNQSPLYSPIHAMGARKIARLESTGTLDLGSVSGFIEGESAESVASKAMAEQLSNVTSGVGFLPSKYVEGIQTFFHENEKFFGRRIDVATLKLIDVFAMLQDRVKAQKELQTKLLSLEFQNTQLSERLRVDEGYIEHQDKLHSLQLLERGILLRELAAQVNNLRAEAARKEAQAKAAKQKNSLAKKVKGIKPQEDPASSGDARDASPPKKRPELLLPNVKIDLAGSSTDASDTQQSPEHAAAKARLLQSSASMPLLSDEYGPVGSAAATYAARVKSRGGVGTPGPTSARGASPTRAQTAGASSRVSSAAGAPRGDADKDAKESGKVLSAFLRAALPPLPKGPTPEALNQARVAGIVNNFTADVDSREALPVLGKEKMAELKAIRAQIVAMVAGRYPRSKSPLKLATTLAAREALEGRALQPSAPTPGERAASPSKAR